VQREQGESQRVWPKPVSAVESMSTFLELVWASSQRHRRDDDRSLEDFVYDLYKQPAIQPGYTVTTQDYKVERDIVRQWHQTNGGRLTNAGGYPALATDEPKDHQPSLVRIVVHPTPDMASELFNFWGTQVLHHQNVKSAKVAPDPDAAAQLGDPIVVYLVAGGSAWTRDAVVEVTVGLIANYVGGLRLAGKLSGLVPGVPPMVEEVWPGIGWAEQPPQSRAAGRSFGEYRAAVIAAALRDAKNVQAFYSAIPEQFQRAGLDVFAPHRNTG